LPLVISWAGAFYPRFIRGSSSSLSNHSWGTAFDINAPQNWLGQQPAAEGKPGSLLRLVPIANKWGFFWGGHYNSRPDGMHFELAKISASVHFAELQTDDLLDIDSTAAPLEEPTHKSAPTDQPATQSPPSIQGENVNINQGDTASVAPANFVPENKDLNAPAKDGATATTTKTAILGITVPPTIYAILKGIQEWIEKGFIDVKEVLGVILDLIRNNIKYIPILAGLIVVVLVVKKIFKQATFMLEMYIAARPDLHNVKVVPFAQEPKRGLWARIKSVWTGM